MQNEKEDEIIIPKKPVIYLDTCILRNCFAKRNEEDIILLEHIRKNKVDCITSVYTLLELFEISKDRKFLINSARARATSSTSTPCTQASAPERRW